MAKDFIRSNVVGNNRVHLDIDTARKLCVVLGANENWAREASAMHLHTYLFNSANK